MSLSLNPKERERAELAAAYADFLARGEQPERLPVGAMKETGYTGNQLVQLVTSRATAAKMERAGAERSRERPAPFKAKPATELSPAMTETLQAFVDGDTSFSLGARMGKKPTAVWQVLLRLEAKGKIRRKPAWRFTPWFLVVPSEPGRPAPAPGLAHDGLARAHV
ncbi:hypothetical protein [Arenimonas alkanexedens]